MVKHGGISKVSRWLGHLRLRSFRISSNQKTWDEIRPGTTIGKGKTRRVSFQHVPTTRLAFAPNE